LVALHGAAGMADGLGLISLLLEQRWDSIHPQLDPDDDNDPMLRINSLAVLTDAATFLREMKEATLIQLPGLGSLSVRSLEIASGELSPADGEAKVEIHSIDAAMADIDVERVQSAADALARAHDSAVNIEAVLVSHVGSGQALNLDPLVKNLRRARDLFANHLGERAGGASANDGRAAEGREEGAGDGPRTPARAAGVSGEIASRNDVVKLIDKIIKYYAQNEPASPVPLLLERAKRLVPMSFMEVLDDLAPDGMAQLLVISGTKKEEAQDEY
jgi:type VI secretion system protein ImpA